MFYHNVFILISILSCSNAFAFKIVRESAMDVTRRAHSAGLAFVALYSFKTTTPKTV